jgi:hypothetical protein
MNTARLMVVHKEKFFAGLERKTGWGKEEVKNLYLDTYFSALEQVTHEEAAIRVSQNSTYGKPHQDPSWKGETHHE